MDEEFKIWWSYDQKVTRVVMLGLGKSSVILSLWLSRESKVLSGSGG
jgi:hypothetical protein